MRWVSAQPRGDDRPTVNPGAMTAPPSPKPTRKAEALARAPPTIASRRGQDAALNFLKCAIKCRNVFFRECVLFKNFFLLHFRLRGACEGREGACKHNCLTYDSAASMAQQNSSANMEQAWDCTYKLFKLFDRRNTGLIPDNPHFEP